MRLPTKITVGTMNFGKRTPAPEAERIVHRAIERGAHWFDTANVYNDGESERILGAALKGRRDSAAVATKVGLLRVGGKAEGLGRERVQRSIDESLKRLGTDHVDLYYLHAPDPTTPIEETLDGVQAVLNSGKAKAWGVSNFAAWQILDINALCAARNMPKPAVSQVLYNLLVRQLDVEYFAFARRHPLHTTIYNPLAGGLLARASTRLSQNKMYARRYGSEALASLRDRMEALTKEAGLELVTVAYAWAAGVPGVDSILAGPGSLPHLDAAIDAVNVTLPDGLRAKLDDAFLDYLGTDARYARA